MVSQARFATRLRKWRAVVGVYFQDGIAYRAQGLVWILTDVSMAVTMPLVWIAAAKGGEINGYSAGDFVSYYLCVLLLNQFVQSHFMWDVAYEVKEGVFSSQIVRPISWLEFMLLRNLTWRCIRISLFVPWFLLFIFLYRNYLGGVEFYLGWQFWVSVALGHLVSIMTVMTLALLALFVQEAQTLFEIYYLPMLFLGGQMFPVAMYPEWIQTVAHWMPFYYSVGAPTEILTSRLAAQDAGSVLLIQAVWVLVFYMGHRLLWKQGLKHYTGVGM